MQTILVTDEPESWDELNQLAPIVHADDYLSHESFYQNKPLRVINLCRSYHYQTIGYYVSLLAEARDHKIIPAVLSIQDVLSASLSKQISQDIEEEIQESLNAVKEDMFVLNLYFGRNIDKQHVMLAKKLYGLFPLPLIRFTLEKKKHWCIKKIEPLSISDIPAAHSVFMLEAAENYFSKKRFHQWRKKQRFHNLAIFIDPSEPNAPSDKKALDFFVSAGESMGLNVDFIDKNDSKILAEYDALFIRATTAIDHPTYRFARRAAQENMVVIDDPQSIMKCSNKVYLAELTRSNQILTPETIFISKYDKTYPAIEFPCVLKKPDSAFSLGVVRVDDQKAFKKSLTQFFKTSDLVLVQQYVPTEFDWRIGVLDNKPLFACRYYMAPGHWQICNWKKPLDPYGEADTISIPDVPEGVIKTALKATRLIGNSLYGVDIKSYQDKHYLIEVNDNPNIDSDVEASVLGEVLYQEIMKVFLQRIRKKHGYE